MGQSIAFGQWSNSANSYRDSRGFCVVRNFQIRLELLVVFINPELRHDCVQSSETLFCESKVVHMILHLAQQRIDLEEREEGKRPAS